MTSLAPFVLGATPAGQVIVPAVADPFTIGFYTQLNAVVFGVDPDAGERGADRQLHRVRGGDDRLPRR